MSPLISVVLPCYNAEKYLREAIESILNQSYQNLEVIIIDDGSTDLSSNIYNSYLEKDSRIKILKNEKNLGLIRTLNYGIEEAKGDFIARMDADDVSEKSRLKKQLSFLINNKDISVLGTNAATINESGKLIHKHSMDFYLDSKTLAFSSYFTQPFYHGSIMARAEVLKNHPYDLKYKHSEDFELWLRINSEKFKLANLGEILYYYRDNANSVSKNFTSAQIKSHNYASSNYLKKETDIPITEESVAIMNNRPSDSFSLDNYKDALAKFNAFYNLNHFTKGKELKSYFIRQRLNIAIQAIKKTNSLVLKLYVLVSCIRFIFSRTGGKYLFQKTIFA